jgi:cobalamin biosynthesis Co2+ chelatase CbiK
MKRLNDYLDFYWIFSLIHTGNTQLIKFNNIEAGWKPILIYQNGYKKLEDKVKDIIIGTGREKNNHLWMGDNTLPDNLRFHQEVFITRLSPD